MKNHQLFIYFICLVSAMGGLLFGYDWVVIGGAKPFYEEYFHIAGDEGMQALAMSIALLGCLLGATMAGFLADRYGRKKLLVLSAFIFFRFFVGHRSCHNYSYLYHCSPGGRDGHRAGSRPFSDVHRGSGTYSDSW